MHFRRPLEGSRGRDKAEVPHGQGRALNCFQHSSRGEIESAYEKVDIKIVTVQRDLARGEADGLQKAASDC
jgi:hypothetical protein